MFVGRVPTAAVIVQPTGVATAVRGGFEVSGRWSFASGIGHAEWVTAGVMVRRGTGPARGHAMVVFPSSSVDVEDDWDALGLRGTGSCRCAVDKLFVPVAFTWDFAAGSPRRGGPLFRLGWPGFVAHESAALAIGLARRALDHAVRTRASASPTDSPVLHHMLGDADMRLRAARALMREICDEAWATVCGGATPSPRLQAEMRSVAAHATECAIDIVMSIFRATGSAAVYATHPVQRCLRDLCTAGQHWLARESAHEDYGRLLIADENRRVVAGRSSSGLFPADSYREDCHGPTLR
jgi:alkylation response protein AidB-like acyl-CoA dehydrogenase